MRILVTGGSGFAGRNLLEHPRIGQWDILAPGRLQLNLLSDVSVSAYLAANQPDAIVHLAGYVGGIQANINEPARFLRDNLAMGMNVVQAARDAGITRLINIGSSCMYPVKAPQPFKEESLLEGPVEPTNEAYAIAKQAVMRLCQYVNQDASYQYKTLIPPGLYGPHAHFDPDRSHLVGAVMARLHKAKQDGVTSVPIWGDGTARREFLYAGDLADAIVTALERFDTLPEVMNVGVGYDLSVDEWVRYINEVIGYRGEFTHDVTKPSGQATKLLNVGRARDWGWRASAEFIGHRLSKTYEWFKAHA